MTKYFDRGGFIASPMQPNDPFAHLRKSEDALRILAYNGQRQHEVSLCPLCVHRGRASCSHGTEVKGHCTGFSLDESNPAQLDATIASIRSSVVALKRTEQQARLASLL